MTLLDFSTAFDTIDHEILLTCLECEFCVCDDAMTGIHSYLSEKTQSVAIHGTRYHARHLTPDTTTLVIIMHVLYMESAHKIVYKILSTDLSLNFF